MSSNLRGLGPKRRVGTASLLWLALNVNGALVQAQDSSPSAAPPGGAERPVQATANQAENAELEAALAPFDFEESLMSSTGLSANGAAKLAVERSPQITNAQAMARSAHWDARTQWSSFLPQLQGYGQYKRVNEVKNVLGSLPPSVANNPNLAPLTDVFQGFNFTQPNNQFFVGANLNYAVSDVFLRVSHAYEAAKRFAEARKLQVDAVEAAVDLDARQAFYAYLLARANLAVFEQASKQADAQRAQIQRFVEAGSAAPVDLMTATSRVEAAHAAVARAEGGVASARNYLATRTGIPLAEIDKVSESLGPPDGPQQNSDDLVKRAIEQRPELKALRQLVGASAETRKAERAGSYPVFSVQGGVLDARPNPRYIPPNQTNLKSSWDIGAVLSWSPNQALVGHQRTQRAEADQAHARAELSTNEDAVRIEVVQAYEDYKAATASARAVDAQLKAAEEAYRVRLATYRVGAGVLVDLLDADLRVTQARLALASASVDARMALARLERAAVLYE